MKKIIIIFFVFLLTGCFNKTIDDARMVKKGMTTKELEYIMGEPWSVEINPGNEKWFFVYNVNGYKTGMEVTVVRDTVRDFYSY